MNRDSSSSSTFELWLVCFIACLLLQSLYAPLRYLKYALPFLALALFALTPPSQAPREHLVRSHFRGPALALALALLLSVLAALSHQTFGRRFVEEAFFLAGPLAVAWVALPHLNPRRHSKYALWVFGGLCGAYLIEHGAAVLSLAASPGVVAQRFLSSDLDVESSTSFTFGLMCLYFTFRRQRLLSILAFLLVIVSFKRVAILATATTLLAYAVARTAHLDLTPHRRWLPVAMVAVNAGLVLTLYLLSLGTFEAAIQDATGVTSNFLLMGRVHLYDLVIQDGGFSAIGRGLGDITTFLRDQGMGIENAHSDILKYTLELGPIAASILLVACYRASTRSLQHLALMFYMNILFLTDNTSIYFEPMFVFYFLQALLLSRQISDVSDGPR